MISFLTGGNVSAADIIETGSETEVKDQAVKMYIYESLETWISQDVSDFYLKKYKANSIGWEGPKPENIRIWIKEVKAGFGNQTYTHVIRVYLPLDHVKINEKKEIQTADTYIYAVHARLLSLCPESGKTEKEFRLINSYHKVRP